MTPFMRVILAGLPAACMAAAAAADATPDLPVAGFSLASPAPGDTVSTLLPGASGDVLRVTVVRPSDPFYMTALHRIVPGSVPAGTRLELRFRARSASRHPVRAVLETQGAPWTSVAETSPLLTPEWRDYRAAGAAREAYPTNGLAVRFQFGHRTGDLELTAVALETLGPDPGWAAARAALEPAAIQARIERYRMGSLAITAVGPDGRPRPGAAVHIAQTRHAFLFGANIFELRPGISEPWQLAYRQRFTALFNYATLPFYWGAFEARRGKPDYPRLDAMAAWCAEQG